MEPAGQSFSLHRCLGRGGFGEVYLAERVGQGGLSTPVAVKLLRRDLAPEGQAVQRLRDEGRLLARLDHPTILRVLDLVELDGRAALVTEYVPGEDLETCLQGEQRIGTRALLQVLGRVAGALDAAWRAPLGAAGAQLRLSHRDVKPSNIRVGRFGDVKLLDFGIARSDEVTREARTLTDTMIGSPPYMAPERFLDTVVRSSSDVFALGATLLEGLIGRRVFDLPVTMLAAHAIDPARYERFVAERLAEAGWADAAVVELARCTLTHDPDVRPTAKEVEDRCEDLADRLSGPTLAVFCRERRWADEAQKGGELEGRVVTAGSLERVLPTIDEPRPPVLAGPAVAKERSRLGLWVGGISVVLLGLAAIGATATIGAAGGAWWWSGSRVTAAPPVEAPAAIEPTPEPRTVPEPELQPEPVIVAPPPKPEPSPAPRTPVVPAPIVAAPPRPVPAEAPAPVPAPAGPSTARITATGAEEVLLVQGATRIGLPADVQPGSWQIHARFPGGELAKAGDLVVVAGRPVEVVCRPRMRQCAAR